MKKLTAIIQPVKFEALKKKLIEAGVSAMTISNAEGFSFQKSRLNALKETEFKDLSIEIAPKIKIEMIIRESDADKITAAIIETVRTGRIGDGKIFISPVDDAIRVRTGEHGEDAV